MEKCCVCEGRVVNGRCIACGMLIPDETELYRLNETRRPDAMEGTQGKPGVVRGAARGSRESAAWSGGTAQRSEQMGTWTEQRTAQGASQKARQDTAQTVPQGTPRGTVQEVPRRALRGNVQKTAQRTAQGGGTSSASQYWGTDPGGGGVRAKKDVKGWAALGLAVLLMAFAAGVDYVSTHDLELNPFELFRKAGEPMESYLDDEYTSYDYVIRQLDDEGENFAETFTGGVYTVGCQLPEGSYTVEAGADSEVELRVRDEENRIHVSDLFSDQEENMDFSVQRKRDLWLYEGATVLIEGTGGISFSSENAQLENLREPSENPLTEQVELRMEGNMSQDYMAGTDFPAGVYDFCLRSGNVSCEVYESGETINDLYFYMDSYYGSQEIKNVALEEGAVLRVETYGTGEMLLELTPSPMIY